MFVPVYRQPIESDWPENELEHLGRCPVCGTAERSQAYSGLQDKVFFCAPGTWTSWRCDACTVVYLDPRPTPESIGKAYEQYYTHAAVVANRAAGAKKLLRNLKTIARNSYLNRRFAYRRKPSLPFAWLALEVKPSRARSLNSRIRHLPGPQYGADRVLDIGCGSGEFLQIARDQLGYRVEGLEVDPRACDVARGRGFNVHSGSLPGSGLPHGQYDHVTLSHVLEHFHYPRAALEEVFALLKPGGRAWVSVPNVAASSIHRFGSNSRLLEPPRHLVMFDTESLRAILETTGFQQVTQPGVPEFNAHDTVFRQSWMMEQGLDPHATPHSLVPDEVKSASRAAYRCTKAAYERAEIITLIGTKP
jgi:2-polyprenyl-3-methyl-5-hydroxy-6-metoxy-1,4-benzoquinol methylase